MPPKKQKQIPYDVLTSELTKLTKKNHDLEKKIKILQNQLNLKSTVVFKSKVFSKVLLKEIRLLNHFIYKANNPESFKPIESGKNPVHKVSHTNSDKLYNDVNYTHMWFCRLEIEKFIDEEKNEWYNHSRGLNDMMILWGTGITSFTSHLKGKSCPCFRKLKKTVEGTEKLNKFLQENSTKLKAYFIPYHFPSKYQISYNSGSGEYSYRLLNVEDVKENLQSFYLYDSYSWFKFIHDYLPTMTYNVLADDVSILKNFKQNNLQWKNLFEKFKTDYVNSDSDSDSDSSDSDSTFKLL